MKDIVGLIIATAQKSFVHSFSFVLDDLPRRCAQAALNSIELRTGASKHDFMVDRRYKQVHYIREINRFNIIDQRGLITLTRIHILLAVLEYGGFAGANKRLHMTQSAVSQTISVLGEELRTDIIIRECCEGIQLSPIGSRIISHLRTIVSEASVVKKIAEQERQDPIRALYIGCLSSTCTYILPGTIHHFKQHHPHIKIIPYEENSTAIVGPPHSGDIDAGPMHFLVSGMYCVSVYYNKFTIVVPESHPLAVNSTISVEQLVGEPPIIDKGHYGLGVMALFKEKGIEPVIKYGLNHPGTVTNFIHQGLGTALLPELTLRAVDGKVRSVALEPTFYRQISLLAKEPSADGSPLPLLQIRVETLTTDGLT